MRKVLVIPSLSLLALLLGIQMASSQAPADCSTWTQVNDNAFGIPSNFDSSGNPIFPAPAQPYANEEGFETRVYKDQLYVGMEADNKFGARLWRTRSGITVPTSQADWEEVAADSQGCPFGDCQRQENPPAGSGLYLLQNDHIDSLADYNGYLYASTANGGLTTQGTRLYRSITGDSGSWQPVIAPGFGDANNTNFKDMQVFQGQLCGGTINAASGAEVWCTDDGTHWIQKNHGGFGQTEDITTTPEIWSGYVYENHLYFGAYSTGDVAKLYRTSQITPTLPAWNEVYSGITQSHRADILGDLGGYLYITTYSIQGILILRSPSGDPGTWTQVNQPGMNLNPQNYRTVVDGATFYNGALYVAVSNEHGGVEVWRTAGLLQNGGPLVDWVQVGTDGLGNPNNVHSELIPFNSHLYAWTSNYVSGQQVLLANCLSARNVILMIGDGMGSKQIEAGDKYTSKTAIYENWDNYWMSTYPEGGEYDPNQAWSNFAYVKQGVTDSAAAATALYTGVKTGNGRMNVSADGQTRLYTIGEKAHQLGRAAGAVSTVYISHATPGAWLAHNDSRTNGFAIADESLWGDPDTTGLSSDTNYGGAHGSTLPPADVLIGAGHPDWNGSIYVNQTQRDKLAAESGMPGAFNYVERISGSPDGGTRLLAAANDPNTFRLAGLFGGNGGNMEYRLANGSGYQPENPTLADMTIAALTVLNRNPDGFVLMVEGGAIDWAAHNNNMDQMIGEQIGFNNAVQAVANWVDDPDNGSSWNNTLVIVTGDHETGYLTAAPGVFPTATLGTITTDTLKLEKTIADGSGLRASWQDDNQNDLIDPGESVYWAWNSKTHTNSLIRLFAKGSGADLFLSYLTGDDPVRGAYLDNTDVFKVMDAVTLDMPPIPPTPTPTPQPSLVFLPFVHQENTLNLSAPVMRQVSTPTPHP
jgi:alkaline phosphatase